MATQVSATAKAEQHSPYPATHAQVIGIGVEEAQQLVQAAHFLCGVEAGARKERKQDELARREPGSVPPAEPRERGERGSRGRTSHVSILAGRLGYSDGRCVG